jgi:hypothetical protein
MEIVCPQCHTHIPRNTTVEIFWSQVDKSGECWIWCGCLNKSGYGRPSIDDKPKYAHRVAWELTYGPIPDGLVVRHQCDNPRCVRPEHLLLGTHLDNVQDRVNRGRNSNHNPGAAKLTEQQVRDMRAEYTTSSASAATLGRKYGISVRAAYNIVHGKTWKHLLT